MKVNARSSMLPPVLALALASVAAVPDRAASAPLTGSWRPRPAQWQPWSNGKVGMQGGSYLGIEQLFAAERRPPGLKAIFPTVPAADPYRDVAAAGGELDAGFLPQWFMLVSAAGAIPPAFSLKE